MQYKMKVRYVIAEKNSDKILHIRLDEIEKSQLCLIGEEAIKIQRNYRNSYVLIKIF